MFFVRASELDGPTLAYGFLCEVLRQLSISTEYMSRSHLPQGPLMLDTAAPLELDDLRNMLVAKLLELSRAFLVLDDVDLCSQEQWNAVEAELAELQRHGLNVMLTSRLSLWHEYSAASCDTGWPPEHRNHSSHLFWYCACQDLIEEALIICQKCKDDGYTCGEW